jgi:hypothetical protein
MALAKLARERNPHLSRIMKERSARTLFFGAPGEIRPKTPHLHPTDVTCKALCFIRQGEAVVSVLPECSRHANGSPVRETAVCGRR